MNAQQLLDYLLEIKSDGVDLSKVTLNYRHDSDSDIRGISYVGEDLYDSETNSVLESIVFMADSEL